MHPTSDTFEYRRRASSENGAQPTQAAQPGLVDERLIDEFARRLADELAPLLFNHGRSSLVLIPSMPAAPAFRSTRPRFPRARNRSHKLASAG